MAKNKRKGTLEERKQAKEEKYLKSIYFDPKQAASLSSPKALHREVVRRATHKITLSRIKKFLEGQESYSLYRARKLKFPRPAILVYHRFYLWESDLMDMQSYADDNDGFRYLLTVIDDFSKFAWCRLIKTKESSEVAKAFLTVLSSSERPPRFLRTDIGSEYKGAPFQTMLRSVGITHYWASTEKGASIVERFHRTLRSKLVTFMYKKVSHRYIDSLQDIVSSYNKTWHRSIRMRPFKVSDLNEHLLVELLFKKQGHPGKELPFKFKLGDQVRIAFGRKPFDREFSQKWSDEIYTISRRYRKQFINMYKIADCSKTDLQGTFYGAELQTASKSLQDYYDIEKIVDRKKEGDKNMILVKFKNYPTSCNLWIDESSVRRTR